MEVGKNGLQIRAQSQRHAFHIAATVVGAIVIVVGAIVVPIKFLAVGYRVTHLFYWAKLVPGS